MGTILKSNLLYLKGLHGLSNDKIGEETGIGQKFRNYVVGKNQPNLEDLIKIAKFFNLSVDDLLYRDLRQEGIDNLVSEPTEKYNISKKLEDMEQQIRQLTELVKKDKGQK